MTHSAESIRRVIDKQRAAFMTEGIPTAEQRIERLDRLIGLLVDNADIIVDTISEDYGARSKDFSRVIEVLSAIGACKMLKPEIANWMKPAPRACHSGQAWVQYQPKGVVGVVSTWNFPVNLSVTGVAGALAAGNRVLLKPSEFTPKTSELLARLFADVFAEDEVAVITGDADVSKAFTSQPFDHLLFTGSTVVGKSVMRSAAENLVPVTLELGGKSPTIISRSGDFRAAVTKIILGKTQNAGQVCLSPDYVFVPEERVGDFITIAKEVMAKYFPTLKDNPDFTSVINARHLQRLRGYVTEAREAGIDVIELNPANEDFSDQPFNKMPITLVRDPSDELQVMQDEIFGPVLPLKPYRDTADVVAYINAHSRPLGLYWFGDDATEQEFVLTRTISGGVTLNDVIMHVGVESLPFGGVGGSGMGAYHGWEGFCTFSHAKAVFSSVDGGPELLRPPFEPARALVQSLIAR